jgi:hypothetical protein
MQNSKLEPRGKLKALAVGGVTGGLPSAATTGGRKKLPGVPDRPGLSRLVPPCPGHGFFNAKAQDAKSQRGARRFIGQVGPGLGSFSRRFSRREKGGTAGK